MKLHEMVVSTDVGTNLIPERLYNNSKIIKNLCDFKKPKKCKACHSHHKKYKEDA